MEQCAMSGEVVPPNITPTTLVDNDAAGFCETCERIVSIRRTPGEPWRYRSHGVQPVPPTPPKAGYWTSTKKA